MGFFYKAGAAPAGASEFANYDALSSVIDATDGDLARTTVNGATWSFSSASDCWVPSEFYDSGLAIQQDRSGTPKDLDFKTPQISDFSGLSGYTTGGTVTDGVDEIEFTGDSSIRLTRETHTGDSLLIVDIDYQTVGTASFFRNGIIIQGHTSTSDELVNLDFGGTNRASDNHAVLARRFDAVGSQMRPAEGAPFTAGGRVFLRWNSGQQSTNTTPAFITCIIQDLNHNRKLRALYAGNENNSAFSVHQIFIGTNATGGTSRSLKLKRFQLLKYT